MNEVEMFEVCPPIVYMYMYVCVALLTSPQEGSLEDDGWRMSAAAAISKAEYLKKYLGGGGSSGAATAGDDDRRRDKKEHKHKKHKKEKHHRHHRPAGIRIIDDDITAHGTGREIYSEDEEDKPLLDDAAAAEASRAAAAAEEAAKAPVPISQWDEVPAKRARHDSPPDGSPPRRRPERHDSPEDASPPRRRPERHDSPEDASPPRRRPERHDSPEDASPARRRPERHDSPEDASPPRRRPQRHDSPEDASPPRRRPERHDSPEDASPARRRPQRHDSPDPSPPRRARDERGSSTAAAAAMPPPRRPPPPPAAAASSSAVVPATGQTIDDASSTALAAPGLHANFATQSAQAAQALTSAGPDAAGAYAIGAGEETVYRDRFGRKIDKAAASAGPAKGAPAERVKPSWGSGLAQQSQREEQRAFARSTAAGPVARHDIDASVDAEKRAAVRFDDPMAEHLAKKQERSGPAKPKYRGPAPPPNRFNLPPGYRWDGVDRSNGYEKQFFLKQAQARNQAAEAHAWSTHDM